MMASLLGLSKKQHVFRSSTANLPATPLPFEWYGWRIDCKPSVSITNFFFKFSLRFMLLSKQLVLKLCWSFVTFNLCARLRDVVYHTFLVIMTCVGVIPYFSRYAVNAIFYSSGSWTKCWKCWMTNVIHGSLLKLMLNNASISFVLV